MTALKRLWCTVFGHDWFADYVYAQGRGWMPFLRCACCDARKGLILMKEILLTQGVVTMVDDEDFERFGAFNWYLNKGYAVRKGPSPRRETVYLHREIAGVSRGELVDHLDRDKLNNRRTNLRVVTHGENMQNRSRYQNNSSGFVGVYLNKKKWQAQISVGGKRVYLGLFADASKAALAYDAAKLKLHGPHGVFNFAMEGSE